MAASRQQAFLLREKVSNMMNALKSSDLRPISRACEPKAKPKIGRSRDQTDPAQRNPEGDAGGTLRHQLEVEADTFVEVGVAASAIDRGPSGYPGFHRVADVEPRGTTLVRAHLTMLRVFHHGFGSSLLVASTDGRRAGSAA
jgi:hypothetical protein